MRRERGAELLHDVLLAAVGAVRIGIGHPDELLEVGFAAHADVVVDRHSEDPSTGIFSPVPDVRAALVTIPERRPSRFEGRLTAHPVLPQAVPKLRRLATPQLALALGVAIALLTVAAAPLEAWAHQLTFDQLTFFIIVVPFAAVGFVVARRVPANPIGWIMLVLALAATFSADDGQYAVRALTLHDHSLPFARAASFMAVSWVWMVTLIPLPIALFPNGRVPVRRLRWTVPAFALLIVLLVGTFLWQDVVAIRAHDLRIDSSGEPVTFGENPTGWARTDEHLLFPLYGAACVTWVLMQLVVWRRAAGESRQQLKWLITGGGVSVVGITCGIVLKSTALQDVGWLSIMALPLGIGVGILRYRLYELDKLISRTVSYVIVTGLLAGVFLGTIALATDLLPFSSPVGVAASTLAVAALFNPLRRRVQSVVDRRFNRARYDAEAILGGFASQLRSAVDLETVQHDLLLAVHGAVEPVHLSVWIRPQDHR